MMRSPSLLSVLVLALASALSAQEGGIEVFAGETLFGEGMRVSLTEIAKKDDHFRSGSKEVTPVTDQKWTEYRTVLAFDYGVRSDTTLTVLAPYVSREWQREGLETNKADGLGDIALLAKHLLWTRDEKGAATNLSVVAGIELPTGATDASTGGVRHQPKAQVGTGSTDVFVALGLTAGRRRWRYDGLLFYKYNTEGAQDYQKGDVFVGKAQVGYRFIDEDYPGATVAFSAGLLYRHTGRSDEDMKFDPSGVAALNSGSDRLDLHFALSAHPRPNLDMSIAIDHPVYQNYNGTQLARDYRLTVQFGIRF